MSSKKVVLYSTTGCPLCQRYKALLDDSSQPFEERNTTENPAYLQELGSRGIFAVPTVLVGEEVVQGFRPNTLTELLAA
jgi:glutaredoxin